MQRRSLWLADDGWAVEVLDQTRLPFEDRTVRLESRDDAAYAISAMVVRGAPLIGATAAYGLALALRHDASDAALAESVAVLGATRPTAVNLRWALERVDKAVRGLDPDARPARAYAEAEAICNEDMEACRSIGRHGLALMREWSSGDASRPIRVMTHCNAGSLATVLGGTALAPIYAAHQAGLAVEVWVSETRPRNQGAALTAWELREAGVPHTVVADNACGHLLAHGRVDGVIVGADRIAANGDVANKVGTSLKALAAHAHGVPFVVAAPHSTIDERLASGDAVPIEERGGREVTHMTGVDDDGHVRSIRIVPEGTQVANPSFDVTPTRFVTAIVTESGIWKPTGAR